MASQYDVFLSFRGEDTRLSFLDHLSKALAKKEVVCFRDDRDLVKGSTIGPELLKAIEESRMSLVILSPNYASSTWCLDELVKILQCRKYMEQVLIPIFYQVQPSSVRNKNGRFLKAVEEHGRLHPNKVNMWKGALIEVSHIAGWVTQDKHEARIIKDIVKCVRKYRNKMQLDSVLKEVKELGNYAETLLDELDDGLSHMFEEETEVEEKDEDAEIVSDQFIDEVKEKAVQVALELKMSVMKLFG